MRSVLGLETYLKRGSDNVTGSLKMENKITSGHVKINLLKGMLYKKNHS
jgi:hypothetical protein